MKNPDRPRLLSDDRRRRGDSDVERPLPRDDASSQSLRHVSQRSGENPCGPMETGVVIGLGRRCRRGLTSARAPWDE